jgi:transcriptional regulator with XRE-family HTH domain
MIPQAEPEAQAGVELVTDKFANQKTVENIGQRIRQLRESRGMTQSQLQSKSKVSRSYLSRIESGQMTPSLGTLEKISEALNVGLNRFFIPESDGEALLEDPFIQGLRPIGNPSRLPQPATANGGSIGHAPSHSNGHALHVPAHGHPQGYPLRRPSAPLFQRPLAR